VLARTADTLTELVRATDLVGRFGGEEFTVLLVGCGPAEARQIAERIREQLARLAFTRSGMHVTASIGLACWQGGQHVRPLAEVVEAADAALYEAKNAGRNLVRSAP
jgi:diguanylate cyclase (GGDEF)-like protein